MAAVATTTMRRSDDGCTRRKCAGIPIGQSPCSLTGLFVPRFVAIVCMAQDATKILFVSLYYSAILPESLFLGALALLIHFGFGKFCLLRIWRQSPDIGPVLAQLSRNFFFSGSLAVHIVMSAYWWSGYPYDKVCGKSALLVVCQGSNVLHTDCIVSFVALTRSGSSFTPQRSMESISTAIKTFSVRWCSLPYHDGKAALEWNG